MGSKQGDQLEGCWISENKEEEGAALITLWNEWDGGTQAQISAIKRSRKPWNRGGFAIKEDDFKFGEQRFKVQVGQPGRTASGVEIQNWSADGAQY